MILLSTLSSSSSGVAIPTELQEVLEAIHPLKRPRAFDLEDTIAQVIDTRGTVEPSKLATLHLAIARAIFSRLASCDVMYTYNVIEEATRALNDARTARVSVLAFEAHCLLSRTYCYHQAGEALDNLRSAREHLDAARKLRPDLAAGLPWAETLLDLARKTQLVSPRIDRSWRPLYGEVLDCVEEAKARGLHQAAREHTGSAEAARPVRISPGSITVAEEALLKAGEGMLTRELALVADGLGEQ